MDNTENVKKAIELFNSIKQFLLSVSEKEFGTGLDGGKNMLGKIVVVQSCYDEMIEYLMGVVNQRDEYYIESFTTEELVNFIEKAENVDYFIKRPVENFEDVQGRIFSIYDTDKKEWYKVNFDEIKTMTAYNFSWMNDLGFSKYE